MRSSVIQFVYYDSTVIYLYETYNTSVTSITIFKITTRYHTVHRHYINAVRFIYHIQPKHK
jgi:hypothetical protein